MSWLPQRWFRPRGWILLGLGLLALLLAAIWGRRDVLVLAIFLLTLPPLASISLRFLRPSFSVKRNFWPAFVERGELLHVTLDVQGSSAVGGAQIVEQLPPHMIDVPRFEYPRPVSPRSLRSRYQYSLRPNRRGLFTIGPLRAAFADPFNVAVLERKLDDGNVLTVAPAATDLPPLTFSAGRGQDGSRLSQFHDSPSNEDVMTREYRTGDSVRRVHWPATARHDKIMVRAEESLTSPEAVLVLDQRLREFGGVQGNPVGKDSLLTSPRFEWAVTAAVSISSHFLERGFVLQILDDRGQPGFSLSPSSSEKARSEFGGNDGQFAVAQSLASLGLRVPSKENLHGNARNTDTAIHDSETISAELVEKLFSSKRRGPLVAVLGTLDVADATILATAVPSSAGAFALTQFSTGPEAEQAHNILTRAGWTVVLVDENSSLKEAWMALDHSRVGGRL